MRQRPLTALDTHDTARAATVMVPGGQEVAAVLAFTLPGMPLVFAGDEFGLGGLDGEDSRTPMPWDEPGRIVADLRALYPALAALRREPALRSGALRWLWAEGDLMVFARELPGRAVLVAAARAAAAVDLPAGLLPSGWQGSEPLLAVGLLRLGGAPGSAAHDAGTRLSAEGSAAAVWELAGPRVPRQDAGHGHL